MAGCMMVMAGGTGGHVFPALAVAKEMQARGWQVFWIGRKDSFEARVVPAQQIEMEWIDIQGVRGKGLLQKVAMPLNLLKAVWQSIRIIKARQPHVVLGMGGFAAGPGGLAAWLMRKPLVIQEQNTIPGMTNNALAKLATKVFEAFPGSFADKVHAQHSGNPVRPELFDIASPKERVLQPLDRKPRLLVLGGSLGAQALNDLLPAALAKLDQASRPEVLHQAGNNKLQLAQQAYQQCQVDAKVVAFIENMQQAYSQADLVICRSGALTVSELMASGSAAILIPFPYAVDDHQTHNGEFLVKVGAAELYQEKQLTAEQLAKILKRLLSKPEKLQAMAIAARQLAMPQSVKIIADACQEEALC